MSILAAVETCLFESEIDRKLTAVDAIEDLLDLGADLSYFEGPARSAQDVVFPEKPAFVNPRDLKRRSMSTVEGLKVFLHAVAHIEFTAIHLALDAAYRFRQTPDAFRRDWLRIAVEEAKHYRAVVNRMNLLSVTYGDYPVHRGLWELAESTSESLITRMALVPRFMEARGLDVTPGMIDKFSRLKDHETVEVLSLILREEIGHVAIGTQWFKWACAHEEMNPEDAYFDLVDRFLSGGVRGPFNREARIQAGFTEAEMQRLESLARAS